MRGSATLLGGFGDDTLTLGDFGGTADGGAGADTITGGAGADTLILDEADTVTGGAGEDLFIVTPNAQDTNATNTVISDYVERVDVIRVVVTSVDDVVTVADEAGSGAASDAVVSVNGDPVAVISGAAGLTVEDLDILVIPAM